MSKWYEQLKHDDSYWAESVKIDFAVSLDRIMHRIGLSKAGLAHKIKSSPAYITKVLRGDTNLTIDSMVKLVRAANCDLHIAIIHQASSAEWIELIESNRQWLDAGDTARLWIEQTKQKHHEQIEATA